MLLAGRKNERRCRNWSWSGHEESPLIVVLANPLAAPALGRSRCQVPEYLPTWSVIEEWNIPPAPHRRLTAGPRRNRNMPRGLRTDQAGRTCMGLGLICRTAACCKPARDCQGVTDHMQHEHKASWAPFRVFDGVRAACAAEREDAGKSKSPVQVEMGGGQQSDFVRQGRHALGCGRGVPPASHHTPGGSTPGPATMQRLPTLAYDKVAPSPSVWC